MKTLRLALAQMNPTVGDLKGNTKKINDFIAEAKDMSADVIAFPELALTGYPPEDLLLRPRFIDDNIQAINSISKKTQGIIAVVWFVDKRSDIYNAAAVIARGRLIDIYHKNYLPNTTYFPSDSSGLMLDGYVVWPPMLDSPVRGWALLHMTCWLD
jgi:NAD+ synthase (glutamine-hydrolysing)